MESTVSEQKLKRIQSLFGDAAALVAKRDGDMFLAAAMAPAAYRADLFTLYAFRSEITRIPFVVSEPMIGEIRLQWWREAIEEIYGNGPVRSHEVATPLAEMVVRRNLPRALFDYFIDGFSHDLAVEPAPTLEVLSDRLMGRETAMMRLAGQICGAEDVDYAASAKAYGLARSLADLPRHASQGRCVIPLDILAKTETDPHTLFQGKFDETLQAAYAEMCAEAAATYRQSEKLAKKEMRVAVLPAAIAKTYLKEMGKPGFNPFKIDPRPAVFRQQWACWRFLKTGRL